MDHVQCRKKKDMALDANVSKDFETYRIHHEVPLT